MSGVSRKSDWLILVCVLALAAPPRLRAQETTSPPDAGAQPLAPPESSAPRVTLRQPADDDPQPPDPIRLPTTDDTRRTEALAWYMAGRLHEHRSDLDKAAPAYRKAIELDPLSIQPYQSLIPILYARADKPGARALALQAAGQSPAGFQLVRGLAAVMVRGDTIADAVGLIREALDTAKLDERSFQFLLVQRDLGVYYRMSEQVDDAARAFRTVFDALLDPSAFSLSEEQGKELLGDAGATYDEIGKAFLDAKLPDLAVRAFDEAAKHREGNPGIHSFNLALVFRETGKPDAALQELQKYFDAQQQTKGRAAYQLLKDLLAELNRAADLVPQLETLLEQDPRNAALAYFLADQYADSDQLDKAAALYEKTLGSSTDPRGLLGQATIYRRQQRAPDLLKTLGQLFLQMPQPEKDEDLQKLPPDVRELVQRFQAEFKAIAADKAVLDGLIAAGAELKQGDDPKTAFPQAYILGKLAVETDRTDDALTYYKLAISMLDSPSFELYRELGEHLLEAKRYPEAAQLFREAADNPSPRLEPIRWLFLYFLTYALEYDGKTDQALEAIAEARASQPDNARLHFQEGWIYYHAERWDKAVEVFEQVMRTYTGPEDKDVVRNCQFSISNIYVQQGDNAKGEQVLEEVLKAEPDNTQANNDLGYLWADQNKNLDRAKEMIEKALKAEPDNAAYLDSMGWVLYRLGQYEEARTHLQRAADLPRGEDSTIFDHLGDCLDKLDKKDEARAMWEKALKLEREKTHPDEKLLKSLGEKLPADAANGSGEPK
jgi:tetratricopeptide (TPR) repeat protein